MKGIFLLTAIIMSTITGFSQYANLKSYPIYSGTDLGMQYSTSSSSFRIWSPTAQKATIIFYKSSLGNDPIETFEMTRSTNGTWVKKIDRDLKNIYYVFRVFIDGKWMDEVPDPYAKAVGTNGKRAMVADLKEADPKSWKEDKSPRFSNRIGLKKGIGGLPTDAVVYELHVRDASINKNSGIKQKGKFLGLAESGTTNGAGQSTGLDHLKELGVTHIHLLPSYDFFSIDESMPDSSQYNWGYDPLNYNVPEGSYSTNPENGLTRIKEFKTMVLAMHKYGLRVVMDVVYNHTMLNDNSYFNQLVPGYYYRHKQDGTFSDASACGNETASERPMMRKFMIESLKHWVNEYHVDGFRFDLMGIHDIETMNIISKELRLIKPDILLYGEGWTAGTSPIPDSLRALKGNVRKLKDIAVFSDDIRDGIKGSVFELADRGFASGKSSMEETIKFGVVAACKHPQIDYSKVNYSKEPYANSPSQVISYCECHDNHVLWDKLKASTKSTNLDELRDMHKLALSIVLTSQGISFLHAGTEFLRTKNGVENSFKSPDSINAIDWALKSENIDVFNYVKSLIRMRKLHPAFRLTTQKEVAALINFTHTQQPGVVSYQINGQKAGDTWKQIFVAYNGGNSSVNLSLPTGTWKVFSENNSINASNKTAVKSTALNPFSAAIFYKD
jgi:pullulanase